MLRVGGSKGPEIEDPDLVGLIIILRVILLHFTRPSIGSRSVPGCR